MSRSSEETQAFYESEAQRYPRIHARPIQRYSAAYEAELLQRYLPAGALCLDVGCGEGRTARSLALAGHTVVGLDFSEQMLQIARRMSQFPGAVVHYCVGDAMRLPLADARFDAAVAVTSLNNVPNLRMALSELARVVRPGGTIAVLVINRCEAAALLRGLYFFPFYAWRWLRGGKKYHSVTYTRRQVLDAMPLTLRVVHHQGMRMLPDMIPEWPFNFLAALSPALSRFLNWLAPGDRYLCAHPYWGKLARFHFVVAAKESSDA